MNQVTSESSIVSIVSKSSNRIVLPAQFMELGGEMAFIMSNDPILADRALRFTDAGLLRLRARRSFSDWLEVYVGTQVLAKRPSDTHGSVLQGVSAGVLGEYKQGYASSFSAVVGPLFGFAVVTCGLSRQTTRIDLEIGECRNFAPSQLRSYKQCVPTRR